MIFLTVVYFLFCLGNVLGFYGGLFSPTGDEVLGYSYHGAFHIWKYLPDFDEWVPRTTVGGHFSDVVDICWEPQGEFLFSCGADQTIRIHAPWSINDNEVVRRLGGLKCC